MMTTLRKTHSADVIGAVHDPANFVFCGYDPWQGWLASKPWLVHFHIKDWIADARHGSLPGEGQGRIPEVIADAVKMGYSGFATMEPHLLGGGPTGGVTGPELFPKAVAALNRILDGAKRESINRHPSGSSRGITYTGRKTYAQISGRRCSIQESSTRGAL